jgi:hypothetical protein
MGNQQPSELAKAIGHAVVGAAAGVTLSRVLRRNLLGVIVGAVLVVVIHEALDAPVSQALSKLGV